MSAKARQLIGAAVVTAIREWLKANNRSSLGSMSAGILEEIVDGVDKKRQEFVARSDGAKKRKAPFVPPDPAEVTAYSIEIGWPLDGVSWCLGYATKDWCTSGSAKMKDWRLAVQKWKRDGIHTKITPKLPPKAVEDLPEPEGFEAWFLEARPDTPFRPWSSLDYTAKDYLAGEIAKERK